MSRILVLYVKEKNKPIRSAVFKNLSNEKTFILAFMMISNLWAITGKGNELKLSSFLRFL